MSAKQIKALKKKKYLIGAGILFVLLIILITSGAIKHNNDIVKTPEPVSLNKKQAVTKALQYTATKNNLNVRFYNENSDNDSAVSITKRTEEVQPQLFQPEKILNEAFFQWRK